MTTVQQVIDRAYARSRRQRPLSDTIETAELVPVVNRALRAAFAIGAKVKPTFFGLSDDVAHDGTGWPRPSDAEAVFRIENPDGDRVHIVPLDDRTQNPNPAVYELTRIYRTVGRAQDPEAADALTMFYSTWPAAVSALSDELDARWVEEFDALIELPVIIHLARADSTQLRAAEIAAHEAEMEEWGRLFTAYLLGASTESARFDDRVR